VSSYDDWKLSTPPEFDDEPRRVRYYVDRTPARQTTNDPKTNDPNVDDDINF
jgi:hypothetical protein